MIEARHGDVDIFPADKLPKEVEKVRGNILALGEATGHHHTVYGLDEAEVSVYKPTIKDINNMVDKYIVIENGQAIIKHQEHEALILGPGIYKTKIEQEFNPFSKEYTTVID